MKTKDTTITKTGQNSTFKELGTLAGEKVRITIKTDTHKPQGFARIHVWENKEWNLIDYIPYAEMKTDADLGYKHHELTPADYKEDRAKLIANATFVLEG